MRKLLVKCDDNPGTMLGQVYIISGKSADLRSKTNEGRHIGLIHHSIHLRRQCGGNCRPSRSLSQLNSQ